MDFICPVEGCDAVLENWESLKEHLKEEHDQDATLESYKAWREEIELNRESEQRQRQRQETEQDDTGTLIESDVPVSDTSLSCPFCEKAFDRGDLDKSFNSVKMHAIRSHGEKLTRADLGLPSEEEGGREPSRRPSYRHKEMEEEEGFFEPMEAEGEPLVRMPDVYQSLWKHSRQFGLSKKGADTFIAAMRTRDPDDLDEMENVLRDMKADAHTIKLLIDNWARQRGMFRGGSYGRGYGGYGPQGYDYRYGRRDRDWQPKDEISQIIDKEYDEARKIRVIKALHGGSEDSPEIQALRDEIRELRQMIREGLSSGETEKISELEDEIKEKDRKLQEEKDQRHRDELKALEERMNTRIEAMERETGTVFERQSVKAVERIGDVSERMVNLGERIIVGTALKHNLLQEEPPAPRERGSPGTILDYLPEAYIERERRVEEGEG